MEEVKQIVAAIRKGDLKSIYFLMGEEPYFIDRIAEFIADHVLTDGEKEFNQTVLYGKDTTIPEIISQARRYPLMAARQVLLIREAQHLAKTIEELVSYVSKPQTSTILVFCYKYNSLDKRKKLYKLLKEQKALVFESHKLYENQVSDWIRMLLHGKGYSISHKATLMLVAYLGTDLSRIHNELDKLQLVLPRDTEITPAHIEDHIGISKDYNNFELKKAIGERDILKASRIIHYFEQNPKDNPYVLTVAQLHIFFSQLLQYHGLEDHSPKNVAGALKINPYFVSEYQTAARNYTMKKVSTVISRLREMDLKSKGVGAQNLSQGDLLKELLVKIL